MNGERRKYARANAIANAKPRPGRGRITLRDCARYPNALSAAWIARCSSGVNLRRSFASKFGTLGNRADLPGTARINPPCELHNETKYPSHHRGSAEAQGLLR